MMGRSAEQTARMDELFEKKNLTPQESAEYQRLIDIPAGNSGPTAKGLTTFQSIRLAELLRKKKLTREEETEYQNLLVVRNGGKPVKLKQARKAAPWYLWLPGLLIFSAITTLWSEQVTMPGTILLGLLFIYALPNMIWKSWQTKTAEALKQDVSGNDPPV